MVLNFSRKFGLGRRPEARRAAERVGNWPPSHSGFGEACSAGFFVLDQPNLKPSHISDEPAGRAERAFENRFVGGRSLRDIVLSSSERQLVLSRTAQSSGFPIQVRRKDPDGRFIVLLGHKEIGQHQFSFIVQLVFRYSLQHRGGCFTVASPVQHFTESDLRIEIARVGRQTSGGTPPWLPCTFCRRLIL